VGGGVGGWSGFWRVWGDFKRSVWGDKGTKRRWGGGVLGWGSGAALMGQAAAARGSGGGSGREAAPAPPLPPPRSKLSWSRVTNQTKPKQSRRKLSWEAATERLLEVSEIKPGEWPSGREARYDDMLWRMYRSVVGEAAFDRV
jgi:hypothetical protein